MKRTEFLNLLTEELAKRHVSDAEDIVEEYAQHFGLKLADGYSEEEIAARLGDPTALAAQFGEAEGPKRKSGNKPLVVVGLCFADVFAGLFFLLLAAWGLVMAAAALAFITVAICLFGGMDLFALLPAIPYWCGVILGLAFAALAMLSAVGCVYYGAFLRQMIRSFSRFQHNALAVTSGEAALPPLPIHPQLSGKNRRCLRTAALVSLALFAACFVLAYIACALSAGSLEFWHVWGWFVR